MTSHTWSDRSPGGGAVLGAQPAVVRLSGFKDHRSPSSGSAQSQAEFTPSLESRGLEGWWHFPVGSWFSSVSY